MIDVKNLPDGRIVVHYLNLLTAEERSAPVWDDNGRRVSPTPYDLAAIRASKIGGKKYRAKWYGGGIVFQSYSIRQLEKDIEELVKKESGNE